MPAIRHANISANNNTIKNLLFTNNNFVFIGFLLSRTSASFLTAQRVSHRITFYQIPISLVFSSDSEEKRARPFLYSLNSLFYRVLFRDQRQHFSDQRNLRFQIILVLEQRVMHARAYKHIDQRLQGLPRDAERRL